MIDGYCRTFRILRPIDVHVELSVTVHTFKDALGCPPPAASAIKAALINSLYLLNGGDVSYCRVRSVIESLFSNIEVVSIPGSRDDIDQAPNQAVDIAFIERGSLSPASMKTTLSRPVSTGYSPNIAKARSFYMSSAPMFTRSPRFTRAFARSRRTSMSGQR